MKNKNKVSNPTIEKVVSDILSQSDPCEIFGKGGIFEELKKQLVNKILEKEMESQVTDGVLEDANAWQNRSLDSIYPMMYLDCIYVKARDNHVIINKAVYLSVGVNLEGKKELLGIWIGKNEGAKFWL
ncbi:MAG: transposase [Rickettsia endosymbiont of Argas persicus]